MFTNDNGLHARVPSVDSSIATCDIRQQQSYFCIVSDINECDKDNGGCSQICNNTAGSFECKCRTGYDLDANGLTCNGNHFC